MREGRVAVERVRGKALCAGDTSALLRGLRLRLGMLGIFNNLKQRNGAFQHKIIGLNSTAEKSPTVGCWLGRLREDREKNRFFFF